MPNHLNNSELINTHLPPTLAIACLIVIYIIGIVITRYTFKKIRGPINIGLDLTPFVFFATCAAVLGQQTYPKPTMGLLFLAVIFILLPVVARCFPNKQNLLSKPTTQIIMMICIILAMGYWQLAKPNIIANQHMVVTLGQLSVNLVALALDILWSIIIVILAVWSSHLCEAQIRQNKFVDSNFKIFLANIIKYLLIFMSVLLILPIFGIDITTLTLLGSAFAAGLGFGLRNIISNYVAGFIILLGDSIRIDDRITINNFTGHVTRISTRFITLQSDDGTKIMIPNEKIISDVVIKLPVGTRQE